MIDPENINTIRVGQLVDAVFSGTDNIPHEVGTDLRRGTINDLATYIAGVIDTTGGLAFLPIAVTDGQTLPATTTNEWFLAGKGTYLQLGGYPDIVCSEELSVIIGNGSYWTLGVSIPITVDPAEAMISQTVDTARPNYSPSEIAVKEYVDERVFLNAVGTFHYADLATQTVPLVILPATPKKLENDTLGTYTIVSNAPFGVSSVWNPITNQLDFSQLSLGDTLTFRIDAEITTTTANQTVKAYINFADTSPSEFDLIVSQAGIKTAGAYPFVSEVSFDLAYQDVIDYPANVYVLSDDDATIKINGWYIEVIRKNINIVDIEVGDVQLNDLLDVDVPSPQIGQALLYDGTKWVSGQQTIAVGNQSKFYLDATASLADNFTLSNTPSNYIETADSISVTTGLSPVFFERFVSAPLGKNTIPAGTWTFNIYGSTSNNTGLNVIDFRVNKRVIVNGIVGTWTGAGATRTFTASSGTPFAGLTTSGNRLTAPLIETPNQTGWVTLVNSDTVVTVAITDIAYVNESGVALNAIYYWLFNDSTGDITGTAPTLYTETLVLPEITGLNDNDRLVIAFFSTTDQASARTITLYYGGTEHFTHFETPLSSLIIDPTPTDGSTNAVSSNGVFDALVGKVSKTGSETIAGVKIFTDATVFTDAILTDKAVVIEDGVIKMSNDAIEIQASILAENITADRSLQLPDASGTFALTSDIPAAITIDNTPTDGSTNAVSSNGVFDALALKQNTLTNPITGTGTTNYLPKFTSANVLGNSQIIDNGTNVLIGTTTDNGVDKLQVNGSIRSSSQIHSESFFSTYIADGLFSIEAQPSTIKTPNACFIKFGYLDYGEGQYYPRIGFETPSASKWSIGISKLDGSLFAITENNDASINYFNISSGTGNVLINTTTDNGVDKLQVNGTISASPATLSNQVVVKSQLDLKADKGLRVTNATTTGSYAIDWSVADVWDLTLTGATTLTDSNLPTGTATKVIELMVKGAFSITLPAYWEATPASGAYTGAKWNHFVVSCIVGTTSSEKVIYSNEVLAT